MVVEFTIPDFGDAVVKVRIGVWQKKVGDHAELDETVVEVTAGKHKIALLAPASGVLSAVHKTEGELARVGEVIGALYTAAGSVARAPLLGEKQNDSTLPDDIDEEDTFITEAHLDSSIIMSAGERRIGQIDEETDQESEARDDGGILEKEVSAVIDLLEAMERSPKSAVHDMTRSYDMPDGRSSEKAPKKSGDDQDQSGRHPGKGAKWTPPSIFNRKGQKTDPPPVPARALKNKTSRSQSASADHDEKDVMSSVPRSNLKTAKAGDTTWEDVIASQGAKDSRIPPHSLFGDKGLRKAKRSVGGLSALGKQEKPSAMVAAQGDAVLTIFEELDVSQIGLEGSDLRREYFGRYKTRLTLLPFFVKAAAIALARVPQVGAQTIGDKLVYSDSCDVGIVYESNKGPVVPVLRDVQNLSFIEVVQALSELQQRVFKNQLLEHERRGGNLTITDFGDVGVHLITPPLHPPKSVALAIHSVRKRPVVMREKVVIRPLMNVSMAYDQRIVQNKNAIAFLSTIKDCIQEPMRLFVEK